MENSFQINRALKQKIEKYLLQLKMEDVEGVVNEIRNLKNDNKAVDLNNWYNKKRSRRYLRIWFSIIIFLLILSILFILYNFHSIFVSHYVILFVSIFVGFCLVSLRADFKDQQIKNIESSIEEFLPRYINYSVLIIMIILVVDNILPLFIANNKDAVYKFIGIHKYILGFILGYAIDGIWEILRNFQVLFFKK